MQIQIEDLLKELPNYSYNWVTDLIVNQVKVFIDAGYNYQIVVTPLDRFTLGECEVHGNEVLIKVCSTIKHIEVLYYGTIWHELLHSIFRDALLDLKSLIALARDRTGDDGEEGIVRHLLTVDEVEPTESYKIVYEILSAPVVPYKKLLALLNARSKEEKIFPNWGGY